MTVQACVDCFVEIQKPLLVSVVEQKEEDTEKSVSVLSFQLNNEGACHNLIAGAWIHK